MRQFQNLIKFVSIGLMAALLTGSTAQAQTSGKDIFVSCSACHKIGSDAVGPDLAGVTRRRSEEWLLKFIKDSPAVVASGDPVAVELFEKFNRVPMPPTTWTDDEIRGVLAYIEELEAAGPGAKLPSPIDTATQEEIDLGERLFTGETRFAKGAASCQTCHQVAGVGTLGGGSLAVDLTRAGDRIGGAGIYGNVKAPSYPLMAQAYADKPLTEDEVFAVTAFLEKINASNTPENQGPAGIAFLISGLAVCAVLIILYSLIWRGRKRGCVYDEIHARQLRSE